MHFSFARGLLLLLGVAGLATGSMAQEAEESPPAASEEAADDASADGGLLSDDADLDLQTYDEDEDDFVPTEEVPADQAIPFPSDI